jgi:hypothetical protein
MLFATIDVTGEAMPNGRRVHIERALFIIGDQNTGKSVQLRSMFRDLRLGEQGNIPVSPNLTNAYPLSVERWLYLRLTSPHEKNETPEEFLDKCDSEMQQNAHGAKRWNFSGAIQPNAANNMPDAVRTIEEFIRRFDPERVRAVVLHPDKEGNLIHSYDLLNLLTRLRALSRTEVIMTDARSRTDNGLIYADFFDFT